ISTQSTIGYSLSAVNRRTLDGQPWPIDYERWLNGAFLFSPVKPPGLVWIAPSWTDQGLRLTGGTDGRRPPAAWYFIRNAGRQGKTYLAGFDVMSKLPIGYIDRNGFRLTPPRQETQFDLPSDGNLNSSIASTQNLHLWGMVQWHVLSSQ